MIKKLKYKYKLFKEGFNDEKRNYTFLNDPYLNKGAAFTQNERERLGLIGILTLKVQTLEQQATQTYAQYQTKCTDFAKRQFLMEIFNTNRTLFYYLMQQHLVEFMPIIYDPVIADVIENYSHVFINPPRCSFYFN